MIRSIYRWFKFKKIAITNADIVLNKNKHLFLEKKMLFIHIPKAAGVSLFHAFYGKDSLGHVPFYSYESVIAPESLRELFKFTFVRNPYDRIYSAFVYLKEGGRGKKADLKSSKLFQKFNDFSEFLLELRENVELQKIEHFRPQAYWVLNKEGNLKLDYVGKLETIEADLMIICEMNNLPLIKLDHLNQSNKTNLNLEQVYDENSIKIVNELYSDDFDLFNYDKIEE